MIELTIQIHEHSEDLPPQAGGDNFFHSSQLFELAAATPRQKPYMVTASHADGSLAAHLLAIVRYRGSWMPPYFFRHCRVLGEGVYCSNEAAADSSRQPLTDSERAAVFGQMVEALRRHLGRSVLYIEVSNLSQKMFGYREFRRLGFFPVHWMSIHNSLHSRQPEERISEAMRQRIAAAYDKGIVTREVESGDDFKAFLRLLRHHNWFKPKRYIPADAFFEGIRAGGYGRLYITCYHEHVIGCSAVAYSGNNAYLWYSAFRRKSFAFVHPDTLTIWHAISDTHRRHYDHIFFLDVGLPFKRNPFREFILSFGGKPVSTYRWFRCSIGWVNTLLSRIYRD